MKKLFKFIPLIFLLSACGSLGNLSNPVESNSSVVQTTENSTGTSVVQTTTSSTSSHTFNDFTSSEKQTLISTYGFAIPFMPTDYYYLESDDYTGGHVYVTAGNTLSDFNAYKNKLNTLYTFDYSEVDDENDTWYYYSNNGAYIDVVFYLYQGEYVLNVFIYASGDVDDSGGDTNTDVTLHPNTEAGLPTGGSNGLYDVDFTKADKVDDVSDQGYYLGGCPTTGDVNVLVIPVEFSDVLMSNKSEAITNIDNAFNKVDSNDDMISVKEFYQESSYNQLNLNFDVMSSWYKPSNPSTYYMGETDDEEKSSEVMNELLNQLDSIVNFSEYDSDSNGFIDAVILITSLEVDSSQILNWAFRYWNNYGDENGYYYEYDNVAANDYLWAGYDFLFEDSSSPTSTYTFIHEFGHVLGADDYYDTSYASSSSSGPLDGHDIMDYEFGDHNPYSKFNYGWITTSKLAVGEGVIELNPFLTNKDTLLLAANFDETLGAYQEYYVAMYYVNEGINSYFDKNGLVIYHVNATLYEEVYQGDTYYDVYNNNTLTGQYASEDNLIELVSVNNSYVLGVGDTFGNNITTDDGSTLPFNIKVTSLGDTLTLEISEN